MRAKRQRQAQKTFQEVLTEAIADMTEHGFDSAERVDGWVRELRLAAERTLTPIAELDQQLRDGLTAIYKRLVDHGGAISGHKTALRFTIDRIRPALRSELDRRILASANLIKLNRAEAIEKTLRRFQGWLTSIPVGGVSGETRAEVKANVRKALSSLPFEERRVLIDQGAKLTASINEIVATDGGAIAVMWRSNWRSPGYQYRPDHKERDGKVFLVRNSWAHKAGLVRRGAVGYYDEVTAFGQEVFCRCYGIWQYQLSELPDEMLTAKGREALKAARAGQNIRAEFSARSDSAADNPWVGLLVGVSRHYDRLDYLTGINAVRTGGESDKWHSHYDPDADEIVLHDGFFSLDPVDQVHTMLHEIGHRGQYIDKPAYDAFKESHLNQVDSFVDMANKPHLEDYERTGNVDGGLASEVFAESYARWCLDLPMPETLNSFWNIRHKIGE